MMVWACDLCEETEAHFVQRAGACRGCGCEMCESCAHEGADGFCEPCLDALDDVPPEDGQ